jgi:hypothetical protein
MKIAKLFLALLAVAIVACEPTNPDTPTPPGDNTEQPNDDENKGDEENKDDEDNSWIDNPTPMPEATYALGDRIAASSLVTIADGKRNDYMTFFDEYTGYAIYLDIYTAESNTTLETGRYPLADHTDNATYREWSYFVPVVNGDLIRFNEGWVEVIADTEHSSGYPYHKIRAYFDMENDESISLEWEGTISFKS